jgi:hypothetical protein
VVVGSPKEVEMSEVAPNVCPECGHAAYIGMTNVECTNYSCRHHHEPTSLAHVRGLAKPTDLEGPTPLDIFRDFCSGCHTTQEFDRWVHPNESISAWCPKCGEPNYWPGDIGDDDTDPQVFTAQKAHPVAYGTKKGSPYTKTLKKGDKGWTASEDEMEEILPGYKDGKRLDFDYKGIWVDDPLDNQDGGGI